MKYPNQHSIVRIASTILAATAISFVSCKEEAKTPESTAETAMPTTESAAYPLTTCVVSGEELGAMGKPAEIVYEGTTVKFCCKNCISDFKEDPAKYLAKLEAK